MSTLIGAIELTTPFTSYVVAERNGHHAIETATSWSNRGTTVVESFAERFSSKQEALDFISKRTSSGSKYLVTTQMSDGRIDVESYIQT